MTISPDATQTGVIRLGRHLVSAVALSLPLIGTAALETPERPAATLAARTIPSLTERTPRPDNARPRTYLAMLGPTAIRFAAADPVLPEEPNLPPPQKAKVPTPPESQATTSTKAVPETEATKAVSPIPEVPPESATSNVKPVTILPDDTRTEIKAEDVLPFFQFPNGSDGSSIVIPVTISQQPPANNAPPSSATYRQQ